MSKTVQVVVEEGTAAQLKTIAELRDTTVSKVAGSFISKGLHQELRPDPMALLNETLDEMVASDMFKTRAEAQTALKAGLMLRKAGVPDSRIEHLMMMTPEEYEKSEIGGGD